MKLNWVKCKCGSDVCKLAHPTNLGQFYQGTGFHPEEREILDAAFAAAAELEAVKREAVALARPFANAAASYDPPDEGDDNWAAWAHDFTIGQARAARAFMEKHGRDA